MKNYRNKLVKMKQINKIKNKKRIINKRKNNLNKILDVRQNQHFKKKGLQYYKMDIQDKNHY